MVLPLPSMVIAKFDAVPLESKTSTMSPAMGPAGSSTRKAFLRHLGHGGAESFESLLEVAHVGDSFDISCPMGSTPDSKTTLPELALSRSQSANTAASSRLALVMSRTRILSPRSL